MSELEIRPQALQRGLEAPHSHTYSLLMFRLCWFRSTWPKMFYLYSLQLFPWSNSLAFLLWGQTVWHAGLVSGGYSHAAREGRPQVLHRPSPTPFEHLESAQSEDEAMRPWQRRHCIATVGTHILGFLVAQMSWLPPGITMASFGFASLPAEETLLPCPFSHFH